MRQIPIQNLNGSGIRLADRRSLGQTRSRFGTPIVLGLAGAGAIYVSKSLEDEKTKIFAQVLGYGAIAYGVYSVVSWAFGGSQDSSDLKDQSVNVSDETAFRAVTGSILSPSPNSEVGTGFMSTKYKSQILLSNQASRSVTVLWQMVASEIPTYLFGADSGWWTPKTGVVAQGVETVGARSQKTQTAELSPLTSFAAFTDRIGIRLTLQIRRSASDPWKDASSVDFTYNRTTGQT